MTTKSELFKNLSPKKRNINSKFMIRSRSNLEPILSKKQKLFGVYKPVKNFHRFGKGITNSGINPDAIYVRFYEREITQPYKNPKFIIEEKKIFLIILQNGVWVIHVNVINHILYQNNNNLQFIILVINYQKKIILIQLTIFLITI